MSAVHQLPALDFAHARPSSQNLGGYRVDSRVLHSPLREGPAPLASADVRTTMSSRRSTHSTSVNVAPRSLTSRGAASARALSPQRSEFASYTPSFMDSGTEQDRALRLMHIRERTSQDTQRIMANRYIERQFMRAQLEDERERERTQRVLHKRDRETEWKRKLERSPFFVDLVAENERLDEEIRVRERQEQRRVKALELKRQQLKTEIIARALTEFNETDISRHQRRIMAEEQRIAKAKSDLQKSLAKAQRREEEMRQLQEARERLHQHVEMSR